MAFLPYVMTSVGCRRRSSVRHKVSDSYKSRTVSRPITKFYTDIYTEQFILHTGHDVTSCFQSATKCD